MKIPPIVYISGSGRSGTNILKEILSNHSKCGALPFEYRFTIDPGGIVDFYNSYTNNWSPYAADLKIKQLRSFLLNMAKRDKLAHAMNGWLKQNEENRYLIEGPYAGWELENWFPGYTKFVNQLIDSLTSFSYQGVWPGLKSIHEPSQMIFAPPYTQEELGQKLSTFLYQCFNSFLQKENKEVFIEDNTWSVLYAKSLFDLTLDAKLVHIIRDPRDVIASLMHQRWTPNELKHVVEWYKHVMETWSKNKATLSKNQFIEIKLEDLIENTKGTLTSLCSFIDLPFEEALLDISLKNSNTGRFKNEFAAEEIVLIEEELAGIISAYNY